MTQPDWIEQSRPALTLLQRLLHEWMIRQCPLCALGDPVGNYDDYYAHTDHLACGCEGFAAAYWEINRRLGGDYPDEDRCLAAIDSWLAQPAERQRVEPTPIVHPRWDDMLPQPTLPPTP